MHRNSVRIIRKLRKILVLSTILLLPGCAYVGVQGGFLSGHYRAFYTANRLLQGLFRDAEISRPYRQAAPLSPQVRSFPAPPV